MFDSKARLDAQTFDSIDAMIRAYADEAVLVARQQHRVLLDYTPASVDSLERLATHLKANDVDINVDKLTLGEFLKMDPTTERFIDNPAADKMLTREYRAPYVVPEKV